VFVCLCNPVCVLFPRLLGRFRRNYLLESYTKWCWALLLLHGIFNTHDVSRVSLLQYPDDCHYIDRADENVSSHICFKVSNLLKGYSFSDKFQKVHNRKILYVGIQVTIKIQVQHFSQIAFIFRSRVNKIPA
jgi:hypothetical protein